MRSGLDLARNARDAAALIREAAGRGAALIATPEMTTLLDRKPRRLFDALPDGEAHAEPFEALARELSVYVLLGSMPVVLSREPRRAANRSVLFGPEGRIAAYDKVHLFDVDLETGESWKESSVYEGGREAVTARAGEAMLGLSICYDLRFPHLYRTLARAGAEVLAVPAAFTVPTGEAHWEVLLRARAIETGSFVLAPAQGGPHEDGRTTYGRSMIVGPWGEVLARLDHDEPGVCVADLDLGRAQEVRRRVPVLGLETSFALRI
jgi:predicted amidohydrolase